MGHLFIHNTARMIYSLGSWKFYVAKSDASSMPLVTFKLSNAGRAQFDRYRVRDRILNGIKDLRFFHAEADSDYRN